jgi:hypothetical protein
VAFLPLVLTLNSRFQRRIGRIFHVVLTGYRLYGSLPRVVDVVSEKISQQQKQSYGHDFLLNPFSTKTAAPTLLQICDPAQPDYQEQARNVWSAALPH